MDKDNIQFTDYALHRMERRGVTREHVWYCVNHHESSEEYCPSKGELGRVHTKQCIGDQSEVDEKHEYYIKLIKS